MTIIVVLVVLWLITFGLWMWQSHQLDKEIEELAKAITRLEKRMNRG